MKPFIVNCSMLIEQKHNIMDNKNILYSKQLKKNLFKTYFPEKQLNKNNFI